MKEAIEKYINKQYRRLEYFHEQLKEYNKMEHLKAYYVKELEKTFNKIKVAREIVAEMEAENEKN